MEEREIALPARHQGRGPAASPEPFPLPPSPSALPSAVVAPRHSSPRSRCLCWENDGLCTWVRVYGCALCYVSAIFRHTPGALLSAAHTTFAAWAVLRNEEGVPTLGRLCRIPVFRCGSFFARTLLWHQGEEALTADDSWLQEVIKSRVGSRSTQRQLHPRLHIVSKSGSQRSTWDVRWVTVG